MLLSALVFSQEKKNQPKHMCWKKDSSSFPCGIRSKEKEKESLLKTMEKREIRNLITLLF